MRKSEVRKWPEMNRQQKIQYLKDYYLFPAIGILILLAIVISLIWHLVKPRTENLLYVAVMNESLDEKKLETAVEDMQVLLGADGKKKTVQIDDSFYLRDGGLDKLQVYLHSQQVDVVILDKELFEEYAGYGYFESLDEVTDEDLSEKYGEAYQNAAGYRENDEISFEDDETGRGEVKPYGISLFGDNRFTEMSEYIKEPVFAVAAGTKNPENALEFLDYLMDEKESRT